MKTIATLGTIVITGECRGAANSICILKYNISKEIPLVFHNGHNYGYQLITK